MASSTSSAYLIYHPEKLRLSHPFQTLSDGTNKSRNVEFDYTWKNVTSFILLRILEWSGAPLAILGIVVEFTMNLFSLNGGVFGIFYNFLRGSMVVPNKDSADYRSVIGHVDGRRDLYRTSITPARDRFNGIIPFDLCAMAAKIAYENQAYVKNVVTNHWKMHFVGHYDFWNDTQAFICSDREEKAELIVVAFRGTEPFSAGDWSTDINLSWLKMGEMGRVHLGFMTALGIQHVKDYIKGWPKKYTGPIPNLAYYTLRHTLKTLLKQNQGAKILVTGHSLGGALAILFPSILVYHQEEEILDSFLGVYTFGQPRIGDAVFAEFMRGELEKRCIKYYRVVFRYDIVPRIPFDDRYSQFRHFGDCVYYWSWYKGEMMKNEPNCNYFDILCMPSKYLHAWLDLVRAMLVGVIHGEDFKESWVSIPYRVMGLLFPGVASHSPRDYVNGARLARILTKDDEPVSKSLTSARIQ